MLVIQGDKTAEESSPTISPYGVYNSLLRVNFVFTQKICWFFFNTNFFLKKS